MRHPVMGPRELFYADIFASQRTSCRSALGMPGVRDRHSACVSEYMIEHDLFDFLLLSLPDNDWHSHKRGPEGQLQSLAQADLALARVANAAGGLDAFLKDHAVIVMADHSQAPVESAIDLQEELAELGILGPTRPPRSGRAAARAEAVEPRVAVCPSQRAAMVYALHDDERDAMRASAAALAMTVEGVDLVMWLERDAHDAPREAVVASPERGELRFSPGEQVRDPRGRGWQLAGQLGVLGGSLADGVFLSPDYPDALSRVWSALMCPTSGEVLLSAVPGWEFADWGRQAHVGGGSHGSLHASDSLGALIVSGPALPDPPPAQWTIRDVAALALSHFGLTPAAA
jgi:hypothetical protein